MVSEKLFATAKSGVIVAASVSADTVPRVAAEKVLTPEAAIRMRSVLFVANQIALFAVFDT
jgi:hypothetical protein